MARVIPFHLPEGYRPPVRWVSEDDRGKVLEFPGDSLKRRPVLLLERAQF